MDVDPTESNPGGHSHHISVGSVCGVGGGLHHHLAVSSPVCQQVSVQVSFAGVALGTVNAGVRTNAAVRQHVFLQIELPPQTFPTFWTGEGLLPWTQTQTTHTSVHTLKSQKLQKIPENNRKVSTNKRSVGSQNVFIVPDDEQSQYIQ